MITTPNSSHEDDEAAKIPPVCRQLFNALFDYALPFSSAPRSIAAGMVQADLSPRKCCLTTLRPRACARAKSPSRSSTHCGR